MKQRRAASSSAQPRPLNRRRARALLGLAAAATLLAACGGGGSTSTLSSGSFDDLVEAGKKEGAVVVYSGMPDAQNEVLTKAFNKKYPDIKVTVVHGAGELAARVESEARGKVGGADVFTFPDAGWFTRNDDLLQTLQGPNVDTWPAEGWLKDKKVLVSTMAPYGMLVWNTDIFPDGFEKWEDLLDPSVKGKIGTQVDLTNSVAGFYDFINTNLGEDYIAGIGRQEPKFYPGATPMAAAVASGEIGVTNLSVPSIVQDLKASGAKIDGVLPTPSFAIAFRSAALKNSPNPNAGQLFLDFVASAAGQEAINGGEVGASYRPGLEGVIPSDGITVFDSAAMTPEKMAEWQEKVNKLVR